jgi:hypothetical protein
LPGKGNDEEQEGSMTTTIKNRQTGETLTGTQMAVGSAPLTIKINGCKLANAFDPSEWEILPPPLPTGIGAVVKDGRGVILVRHGIHWIDSLKWGWAILRDEEVLKHGCFTVLSEGVNPSPSEGAE